MPRYVKENTELFAVSIIPFLYRPESKVRRRPTSISVYSTLPLFNMPYNPKKSFIGIPNVSRTTLCSDLGRVNQME